MARNCTVCQHPERDVIDVALATDRQTCRGAAEKWHLEKSSVARHRGRHLPLRLLHAAEAEEIASAQRVLSRIDQTEEMALALIERGMREDEFDGKLAVAALRERRACLELLGKVSGLLKPDVGVLVLQPAWLELRDALVDAIRPFPEAQRAVLRVLEGGA